MERSVDSNGIFQEMEQPPSGLEENVGKTGLKWQGFKQRTSALQSLTPITPRPIQDFKKLSDALKTVFIEHLPNLI